MFQMPACTWHALPRIQRFLSECTVSCPPICNLGGSATLGAEGTSSRQATCCMLRQGFQVVVNFAALFAHRLAEGGVHRHGHAISSTDAVFGDDDGAPITRSSNKKESPKLRAREEGFCILLVLNDPRRHPSTKTWKPQLFSKPVNSKRFIQV